MKISIENVLVLYLIVGIIICNLLPLPEMVKGFFGMFSFLAIPYLIGNIIFFKRVSFREWRNKLDILSYSFLSWSFGTIVIVLAMTTLYAINLFDIFWFTFCLLLFIAFSYLYYFYPKNNTNYLNLSTKRAINVLLLFILSISVSLTIWHFNPFPLWVEGDFFNGHNPLAWYIVDYNQIFRSFAYIDSFSILTAINSYLFNCDTFTSGWMYAHFLFPFIFLLGLYYFLRSFKIKKGIIFLIIWCSILIFATRGIGSPFHSSPKTIIFLLTPFVLGFLNTYITPMLNNNEIKGNQLVISLPVLGFVILIAFSIMSSQVFNLPAIGPIHYLFISLIFISQISIFLFVLKNKKNLKDYYLFLFIIISILIFNHILMGLLVSVIAVAYLFFIFFSHNYPKKNKIFSILFIVLVILLIISQNYGLISIAKGNFLIPSTETMSIFEQNFGDRLNNLIGVFSKKSFFEKSIEDIGIVIFFWFFFIIGVSYSIFKSLNNFLAVLETLLLAILIFLFILDVGVFREIVLIYAIVILFISIGIQISYNFLIRGENIIAKVIKPAFLLIVAVIFMIYSVGPSISCIDKWTSGGGDYSGIVLYEYETANWIKNHISKSTILMGDFSREKHISSISHIRQPLMEVDAMKEYVYNLLLPEDPAESYDKIKEFTKNESLTKFYGPCWANVPGVCIRNFSYEWMKREPPINSSVIVITAYTIKYMKEKEGENFDKNKFLNKFSDKIYFTPLYNNSKIYIFGVNPKPGIPFKIQNNSK